MTSLNSPVQNHPTVSPIQKLSLSCPCSDHSNDLNTINVCNKSAIVSYCPGGSNNIGSSMHFHCNSFHLFQIKAVATGSSSIIASCYACGDVKNHWIFSSFKLEDVLSRYGDNIDTAKIKITNKGVSMKELVEKFQLNNNTNNH